MVCPQCQRELFVDDGDTIGECPYCQFEFTKPKSQAEEIIGFTQTDSAVHAEEIILEIPLVKRFRELTLEKKGCVFHYIAFAFIAIQYWICICNPLQSGLHLDASSLITVIPIFSVFCVWSLRGGFFPTIVLTGWNIIVLCFLISEWEFAVLKFSWLMFVSNALLLTPASFAFRRRNKKVFASLICPYCASELENTTVTVCSKCGRTIKYVDGEDPVFVKDEACGNMKSTESFCTACGSKRPIGAKFCGNCGQRFE